MVYNVNIPRPLARFRVLRHLDVCVLGSFRVNGMNPINGVKSITPSCKPHGILGYFATKHNALALEKDTAFCKVHHHQNKSSCTKNERSIVDYLIGWFAPISTTQERIR